MPVIQQTELYWTLRCDNQDSGVDIDCAVTFDRDRMQWRATGRPTSDAPTIEAYADSRHGAALACFARWLGCEADPRGCTAGWESAGMMVRMDRV